MHDEYISQFIGTPLEVLIEEEKDGKFVGFSKNYIKCIVDGDVEVGSIVRVMPIAMADNKLVCKF